jgi:hypothetical protein
VSDTDETPNDLPDDYGADDATLGEATSNAPDGGTRELLKHRGPSETTRKLFAKAAEAFRAANAGPNDGDELVPADIASPPAPGGQTAAASPPASQVSSSPNPPGATAAPDAAAVAAATKATADQAAREQAIAEREQKLSAREAELAAKQNYAARYNEAPGATLLSLIKEWTGTDGDELRDEVADIVSDLSAQALGLPLPETHKARLATRTALRTVKQYKAETAKRDAELAEKEAAAQQTARERDAVTDISKTLDSAKDKYPHLMAQDDAGSIVWSVIRAKHAQMGNVRLTDEQAATLLTESAALAEQHYKKQDDAWFARRRHLLAPAASQAPAPKEAVPQGDPQSRRSSTLTNRATAPIVSAPPQPGNGAESVEEWDRETHRRRSLARLRGKVSEAQ